MGNSSSKKRGLRLISGADRTAFDLGAYSAALEKLAPEVSIPERDLDRYVSYSLIDDYVSHFTFDSNGKPTGFASLSPRVLEGLAERFRRYLKGRDSLDQAFGLPGKGRTSPRERFAIRSQTILMKLQFKALRDAGTAVGVATEKVATTFNVSIETAKARLRR